MGYDGVWLWSMIYDYDIMMMMMMMTMARCKILRVTLKEYVDENV